MKKHLTKKQVLAYRRRVLLDADEIGVTAASRRYGIHRDTIYDWRRNLVPQKPGPRGMVFWQTKEEVELLILQVKLSTDYEPKRIKDELQDMGIEVGEKAIRNIVEAAGMVKKQRKPKKKTIQPFYAPYPGYRIQIDTKAVPVPESGDKRTSRRQQFTAIDIVSKVRYLEVLDGLSNMNSVRFIDRALEFYASIGVAVECVQTDNHSTFTNMYVGDKHNNRLRTHMVTQYLEDKGIEHKLSLPGTPRHNGFVERSHRTDEEEFYGSTPASSLSLEALQDRMKLWQVEYNETRRHSACNNLPPMEYFNMYWKGRLDYAEVS